MGQQHALPVPRKPAQEEKKNAEKRDSIKSFEAMHVVCFSWRGVSGSHICVMPSAFGLLLGPDLSKYWLGPSNRMTSSILR